MRNNRLHAVCLAILATFAICLNADAALKTLHGHVPGEVKHLTPIGRPDSATQLHLAIGLSLRDQSGLSKLLHDLYDPSSTNYHRYLIPEEFAARFGPTTQDYQAVLQFAQSNGLTVTRTHANRVLVDVSGEVSDIEKAFHITLQTYRHPTEARNFFAPDTEPSIEENLPILDVSGLSDFARAKPFLHQQSNSDAFTAGGSGPGSGYIGNDFRNAYVPGTTLNGFGQMVGLVQFSGYDPNDIFAYEAQAGLPNVALQNILLDGSIGDTVANGNAEAEVCLDIEMTIAMATNLAAVVVFEAPYTNSAAWFNDVLNSMASSNQIKQLSCSWGFLESPSQTTDQIFQQMAAQGQSFFQASGDGDAWTSPIWWPADSTNLTVVGGTTLSMNGTGASYLGEKVWNPGPLSTSWVLNGTTNYFWGSGGGVSENYTIPYWQAGVNMTTNLGSTTMRNIPDVALAADNVYVTHKSGSSDVLEGTSCAAPLWAGFMALLNQQAQGLNMPSAGFINPAIYSLGTNNNYTACFHDITTGSNTWPGSPNLYYAVPGYDLCTGWGTPAGTNLINALSGGAPDQLVISPLAGFIVNGAPGGPFSGTTQTFSLINTSNGPVNWSIINTSPWLALSQAVGTLASGNQTNITINLTAAANALAPGNYSATILITNQTSHIVQPRVFTLRIGQSLVQDGGFESGSFCHWTLAGRTTTQSGAAIWNGVESPHPKYNTVHFGNYGALMGDTTLSVLYQTLPTCPGQKYLLSFWVENTVGGSGEQFQVNWNTNGTATNTIFNLTSPAPSFAWTNYHFVVTAAGTTSTLQFGAQSLPNFFGLDDISVLPVPQPSFSSIVRATNGFAFTWATLPYVGYILQYNTNLLQTNWINLGAATIATTNTLTLTDTNSPLSSPARFYRLSVIP